jgi:hypothetical protein
MDMFNSLASAITTTNDGSMRPRSKSDNHFRLRPTRVARSDCEQRLLIRSFLSRSRKRCAVSIAATCIETNASS